MHPRVKVAVDPLNMYGRRIDSIIELDVGDGLILSKVAKHVGAKALYGCDVDNGALNKASEKGITTVKADLNTDKLPFPDNYFDAVIMEEVIEHLVNPDNALEEAYRILKPDGIFILTTPNLAWWVNRLILLLGYQPYWSEVSTKYNVGKLFRNINEPLSGHINIAKRY
jgi:ubiquinone/menaquinone biosynthesis C-methylase UbiE